MKRNKPLLLVIFLLNSNVISAQQVRGKLLERITQASKNREFNPQNIKQELILRTINGSIKLPSSTQNEIDCKPNLISRSIKCSASPLAIKKGDKIYSAEKGSFEFKENQGITLFNIDSSDLFITGKDSSTKITKELTELGNARIAIEVDPDAGNDFRVSATSSKFIHKVSDSNSNGKMKTLLEVKDGVEANFQVSHDENNNYRIKTEGLFKGGLHYDSNPFSDEKVEVDSNSTLGTHFELLEGANSSTAVFAIKNVGKSPDGSKSQLVISDSRDSDQKNHLIASGDTSVVVSQEISKSGTPLKTSFVASSDKIIFTSKDKNNQGQTYVLDSLEVSASNNNQTDVSKLSIKAKELSYVDSKKNDSAQIDGNLSINIEDNGSATVAGITADRVVVSTNDLDLDTAGSVNITGINHKDPQTKIDGKKVESEILATADSIKLKQDGRFASIDGGVNVYVALLEDGSSVQTMSGESGKLSDKEYDINFSNNATIVNKLDKDNDIVSTSLVATDLSGTGDGGISASAHNTTASLNVLGKTKDGLDIQEVRVASEKLFANDDEYKADIDNANVLFTDNHTEKYGVVSFDKATIDDLPEQSDKLTLNKGVVSYYENETKEQVQIKGEGANLVSKDYFVNISAIGKNGETKNFNIFYVKEGEEEIISIFTEDGELVELSGSDKDGNYADILLKAADYYQNDEFRTLLATDAKANIVSEDSKYIGDFDIAKINAYESLSGDRREVFFEDGKISALSREDNIDGTLSASSGSFVESTQDGIKSTSANIINGNITANEGGYREGQLTFDNLSYNSVGERLGEDSLMVQIENGTFSGSDYVEGIKGSGEFDLIQYYQGEDITSGNIVNGDNILLAGALDGGDRIDARLDGVNASFNIGDKVKYGTLSFDKISATQTPEHGVEFDSRIVLNNGAMVFYEDSDANKKEGHVSADSMNGVHEDYTLSVSAIGNDGTPGKFNIYYLEENGEKNIQVFGEDGNKVHLTGSQKDENYGDLLFSTASAFENNDFKQFMATNVEANLTDISPTGSTDSISRLDVAKVAGFQASDGSLDHFEISALSASHHDFSKKLEGSASIGSAKFSQSNYLGTIKTNLEAYDSVINVRDYSKEAELSGQINMGSILYNSVENAEGKNMSFVSVNDIEFMAMDYDNMIKATGNIGEVSYLDNNEMTVIDIKDLQNLKVDSLEQDVTALFNGKRFMRVENKDSNGNVLSSYLLVNDASLNVKGSQDGFAGKFDLNARVFEYIKDEVTGESRIAKADVDFKGSVESTDYSFLPKVKVSGALKGENITTSSSSFSSNDGNIRGGTLSVNADKLEHLSLKAEVGFIELASFEAKGKNGKSINYSYTIDDTQGVITLRGVYKDGDSLKTKFLFFKLGSHKEGNDAVQSLGIYLKGQSVEDHMRIMSEFASIKQVNSFFGVSDGGAISLTAGGGDKGFALELLVANEKWAFNDSDKYKQFKNYTNSVGLNVKYITEDDSVWGAGVALTSDSKVNFDGDLTMFNQKVESLPTTLNLNLSHYNPESGFGVVGGVNVPLTTYAVDTDILDDDAQFYDNGRRKANGPGAHIALTKKFKNSELRFSGGMYNNFKEPAVAISYQGTPEVLANLGRGIINLAEGEPFDRGFKSGRSPSSFDYQKKRHERIRDAEIQEFETKRMVVVEKKIDELIKYYADKKGFLKVKEVLRIAKEYLTKPIDPKDYRKDIFGFRKKDMVEYRYYEEDEQKVEDLENIILALIENRIMIQLPLEHKSKLSMYKIYKERRHYMNLDALSDLNKINEQKTKPCHYYMTVD